MAEEDFKVLETFLLYTTHLCELGRAQAAEGDFLVTTSVISSIRKT